VNEQEPGYYESTPKLEDRPSLYAATARRIELSDHDKDTGEYKYSDQQLIELVTYWENEYRSDDYYSPRALKEMDQFIQSVLFELRQRQIVSNATRSEIESIEVNELA
jgi:hypothetical protein